MAWSAMASFIWQERNSRIFKGIHRSPDSLVDQIKSEVRMKAFQFRSIKPIFLNLSMSKKWLIPPCIFFITPSPLFVVLLVIKGLCLS